MAEVLMKIADTRKAINMNPIPMVTVDTDLNFTDANDTALELFGWDREEALRQNVKALDVLDLKGEHIAVTLREKRLTSCEVKLRCPKGILILREWAAPLLDSAGNVRAAHMELIDITQEKKAAANVAAWYESILDAVQFPIAVTDLDMNWTLVNAAAEKLIGKKRADILGKPCSTWKTGICNTNDCAIARLRRGETQTLFDMNGGRFQVDTFYVKDADGEPMGHVEIIEEVTGRARVSDYMEAEVNRLAENLERLARGDLDFDLAVVEADEHTQEMHRDFAKIAGDLERVKVGVGQMVADTERLTRAAAAGNLALRADIAGHRGDFRAILEGVNDLLDAIVDPMEVTADYINRIGRGEIPEKITAEYRGDFNKIKESLNLCIDGLAGLAEADHVLQRMAVNDHTVRMTGQYRGGIYAEVATAVNAVQDRVNYVADTVEMLSRGDLSRLDHYRQLGGRSEQDRLVPGFIRTFEALQALVKDTDVLTQAARKGDLGKRADTAKHEGGEYRTIVEGVNETLDTIVVPFKKMQNAVVQLESSTQETSKSSDEIAKATEQVAVTSQKCADLAKQVLNQIESVESQMADLSASNEEVAGTAQEVLAASNETALIGKEGLELGEAAKRKMGVVEEISQQSMDEITRLNQQMAEIGKIVKLINDIANQTNLLALNAAIEAARAGGEHGRGFAVVAGGEIRNLAGESKRASHNIEDLISSIIANSNKTAANMGGQVYAEIEEGVESVNRTIAELKKIVTGGAEMVSGDMGEIARAIEGGQANVANRVVEAMGEGTRLTKETQAEVENLASLSEETSASTEEIGSAAHELNNMAGDLKATMQRFSF
ncbi:methyl-accepting chemotaxis protein [Methanoculleus chikugoensis]|uniref:methyl-accepting chemotaxis protein n=1 Tax=Methanoculleus chikugoensis TaxID=118126 RepID=UPI0006D2A159|nr:methyl-accepting chemotaxis protein [Methanoculleus chikugoensis]